MRWFRRRPAQILAQDRLDISEREALLADLSLCASLAENLRLLRQLAGTSPDVVIREVTVMPAGSAAAVVHVENLINKRMVETVVQTLGIDMVRDKKAPTSPASLYTALKQNLLPCVDVQEIAGINEIWNYLVSGYTVVLIDRIDRALCCNTQHLPGRAIKEPDAENVIRGPREGFVENLHLNLALLRKRIRTPNLQAEMMQIGALTRTDVAMVYIKGLTRGELLQEVRQRLSRIQVDGVLESGNIEEFITDHPFGIFPMTVRTERIDKVAAALLEGRMAILMNNTPFVIIIPICFAMLFQASDDYYEMFPTGTTLRLLRYSAFLLSMLLPALYVAVITFHTELLPTNLLLRVTAAREGVPFPVWFEVFMMEAVFELLREAGVRLPQAVGPAVSIVGALVLGEAAIQAGLVSPAVVIVVALTAIASFTAPIFSFGIAARLFRFIFIVLAGGFGLFGVQFGVLALLIHTAGLRSFGYPFFAPIGPLIVHDLQDMIVRLPIWAMVDRPKLLGGREPERMTPGQNPSPPPENGAGGKEGGG